MNKSEFITFMKHEELKRPYMPHWGKVASNSDDYWKLIRPAVDWLEDDMDLTTDYVVKITYNKSLYSNESAKVAELSYEEFVENYDRTLR
jgi:hypothetical protein